MAKFKVVVIIKLSYNLEAKDRKDAREKAEDIELPDEYVEDSFDIVEIEKTIN